MADVARTSFRFASPVLGDLVVPRFEVRGNEGPSLALIAGVHGCEYSSIAAVGDVVRALQAEDLAGRVIAIPVVNGTGSRRGRRSSRRRTGRISTVASPAGPTGPTA